MVLLKFIIKFWLYGFEVKQSQRAFEEHGCGNHY